MAISPKTRFEIFKRDTFTCQYCGRTSPAVVTGKNIYGSDLSWLRKAVEGVPAERIRNAMVTAINARKTSGLAYVNACVKNWRQHNEAA